MVVRIDAPELMVWPTARRHRVKASPGPCAWGSRFYMLDVMNATSESSKPEPPPHG